MKTCVASDNDKAVVRSSIGRIDGVAQYRPPTLVKGPMLSTVTATTKVSGIPADS
jgi:hypothetical protein